MSANLTVLGDFELRRELGRGGMGIVYEARQVSLNRKVALKVLKVGLGLTTQAVARFRREAAAAAKLHHTNIVPIYATGEDGDYHFYAMELIEGSSLDRVIRAARLERDRGATGDSKPQSSESKVSGSTKCETKWATKVEGRGATTQAEGQSHGTEHTSPKLGESTTTLQSGAGYFDNVARMFAETADGLDHAHQQGVIHRDIKPSNLLLSPQGRLHLTDFGLARVLEEPGMTVTGEFMGSPLYMSPEQIAAGRAPLDHRTDIYSLGATLYEALTLQPPFQGERRDQVIAQILHKEPKPLRALDRKIPPDLETICLKAMDKDPDRRYPTAGALAEDLRRFVNRFEIEARRANLARRTVKWVRRHPAIAVASATMLGSLLLVGLFARQTQLAKRRVIEELRRAAIQEAVLAARSGDPTAAEQAIERAERLQASPGELRLWRGQIALDQLKPIEALRHLKQAVQLLPESVAARGPLATASLAANGRDWETAELELRKLAPLAAKTADDFLFKGEAEMAFDPEHAIQLMDEGIKRGDSVMARILRAEARGRCATLTGSPADVRQARKDIDAARTMKPDNPAVIKLSLDLHTIAARVFSWKGLDQERQNELELGTQDLQALDAVKTIGVAWSKGLYWIERGDQSALAREWEPYAGAEGSEWIMQSYVPELYGQGQFAKALAWTEKYPNSEGQALRCFILPELPDGPRRAYETCQRGLTEKLESFEAVIRILPLQLLGRGDEATAAFKALLTRFRSTWRDHWYERLMEYETDKLNQSQLLAFAGDSQWNLCEAHFYIALKCLGRGDRAGGQNHFRQSAATPIERFYEHRWSCAFLKRMDADPNWPLWIVKTKAGSPGPVQ